MSSLLRNTLFALGLAFIVWIGYTLFFQDDDITVTSEDSVQDPVLRDAEEMLTRLRQLETVNISGTLFSDARFSSLVDIRQAIQPEPQGRENPFVPFQVDE